MKREARSRRTFLLALAFSVVFHLSTVTLFRIVIFFPRTDIEYFRFEIVHPRARPVFAAEELSHPDPGRALDEREAQGVFEDENWPWGDLPAIELPKLEFAELDRLRIRVEGLEVRARYSKLFRRGPDDAWARFGQRLSALGDALARVALGRPDEAERPLLKVSRPAPGYEALLEWMIPPYTRQAVSVAKVEALWGLDSELFNGPIAMVFKVNREGRVTEVMPPVEDEAGIVEGVVRALLQFRFEPIGEDGPRDQHGTLLIRASDEWP